MSSKHPDIWFDSNTLSFLRSRVMPPSLTRSEKARIYQRARSFSFVHDRLFQHHRRVLRLVPKPSERNALIAQVHRSLCHAGVHKTVTAILKDAFWSDLRSSVQKFLENCEVCQQKNAKPLMPRVQAFEALDHPFQKVALDVTFYGSSHPILTILDLFSKFLFAQELSSVDSGTISGVFCFYCYNHHMPESVLIDNGPEFKKSFREFCFNHDIRVCTTQPRHPFTNGAVERANGVLKSRMYSLALDSPSLSFSDLIKGAVAGINSAQHSSTKFTPLQILESKGSLDSAVAVNLQHSANLRNDHLLHRRLNKMPISWDQLRPGMKVFYTLTQSRLSKRHLRGPAIILLVGIDEIILSHDKILAVPFGQISV